MDKHKTKTHFVLYEPNLQNVTFLPKQSLQHKICWSYKLILFCPAQLQDSLLAGKSLESPLEESLIMFNGSGTDIGLPCIHG